MRPHNGWWRASSTPRRWIDLIQEPPRLAVDGKAPKTLRKPAAETADKVGRTPIA
ncbi:hypothetical protein [Achromobacter sp. Marseille-Q4962]|uniref:hypothetical protein n=1 Tax=Achromobacter sp. Marseille-Q4962 TaxID=2942202 RepID=UPI00207499C6|nr:hypothetical protein [Achromobacter sp. Marseille-Q4962]